MLSIVISKKALTFMSCMLLPISAATQIYKWVDTNGKVQYGDRPPSDMKSSEQFSVKSSSQAQVQAASLADWEEKDREFRKRRIEQQMRDEKEQASVSTQQLCLNARHKLDMLDGKVVYRINDKGERVYMEDVERNAIERKAQQDISRYCRQ